MIDFPLSYREVTPDQTLPEKWKEFNLNTGGTQSTLQDIKVPERANGYCYKDSSKHHTRNRFIYWRICNDILELVEQSLDVNLSGNRVRFKFTDTPILDGITIHEYYNTVIILVPTVCSVHRLVFPHPNRIHKQDEILGSHPDLAVPSIFSDISASEFNDPATFFVFNSPSTTNSELPHVAASYLNISQEETIFVFGYPSGQQLLVKHSFSGHCSCIELKQETKIPRFLSGLAGALRGKNSDGGVIVSLVLHSLGLDIYAIALCRDGNLRVWSCQKGQHVAVSDVLADTADAGRHLMLGAQNHILRKSVDAADSDVSLGVFLNFSSECQFHIFRPSVTNGIFKITRIATLYAPEDDLIDFTLDSHRIYSISVNPTTAVSVQVSTYSPPSGVWQSALLSPPLEPEYPQLDPSWEPREAYTAHIFKPGRFPTAVIAKALSIYRRSAIMSDGNISLDALKQRVCQAVETEIRNEVREYEVSDMEYLDITSRCWSRFYSCCVQYYAASAKPLGLLLLPSVSGIALLKKNMYSFLRPLDALEQMTFCSETTTVDQFSQINHPQLSQNPEITNDLIQLMNVLATLDQQLTTAFKFNIEREMAQLKSPDKVMSELVIDLMAGTENPILSTQFLWSLSQELSNVNDLYAAMHLLLEILRMDGTKETDKLYPELSTNMSINHLFSSELGVSVISECLNQQATIRFSICRNLLLLQHILLERRELDWGILEAIRSVCMPDTVVFMQAYYVIMWLSEQEAHPTTLLDTTQRRLAPLKLPPIFGLKSKFNRSTTLLELFIMSTGGSLARSELQKYQKSDEYFPCWQNAMLLFTEYMARLVWAVSGDVCLAEWLLASGQHLLLQQYVRLLNYWCEWNNCSRNFILASALLNTGEFYKAQDLFLKASKGIFSEKYLAERVKYNEEDNDSVALVNYHLKIINLFELHGARDCAMNVARTALSVAESNDPHIATLHSVMFVHHLALGHYEEAYTSLIDNPDTRRKEDNLRDLVKTLLDKKMLDTLMSFPYVDMDDIFTTIVMARARACDSVKNIFYDFLYAFEVKRGNFRLAATAMYEQAYRLGQHNSVEALEHQVKCYLACINCLHLVDDKLQWVLRPIDQGEEKEEFVIPNEAGSDPNKECEKFVLERQVIPMNFESIQKEYELANARLRLTRLHPKTLANQFTTPGELVMMLSNVGVFKCALSLCKKFKLPYENVFSILTTKCIRLSMKTNTKAWNWLVENDLADMTVVDSNPATVAWNLLQNLLEQYEEPGLTTLHKVVLIKLIANKHPIPYWLSAVYKLRNPAELLRILIKSGRILEATNLATQHIWAALGKGKEKFGFNEPLVPFGPQYCMPIFWFHRLTEILKLLAEKFPKYKQDYESFNELFNKYVTTYQRVSEDMVKMARLQTSDSRMMIN